MPTSKKTEPAPPGKRQANTEILAELLRRPTGATLAEITEATGWLAHSARARVTGLRKQGTPVVSAKVDGVRRYSIDVETA